MSAPKYSEKSFIQFFKKTIKANEKLPVKVYGRAFAVTARHNSRNFTEGNR